MNWHKRYKEMKKRLGYTNHDVAEIIGNTYDSVKSTTQPKGDFPRWAKLAIVVSERCADENKQGQGGMDEQNNKMRSVAPF